MQTLVVHIQENFAKVFVARMIEWEHSIMLLLFGVVLIVEPGLFNTAASYASFKHLYDSYAFWGLAAMAVGAVRFLVLLVNGTVRRSPHLRALLAALTAFFWFEAAYGAVVSDRLTPLTAISVCFFGWQFVIFMICIRYAKLEDVKAVPRARQTDA